MNSFLKGMIVGVGIGLLVAPMRGEEMRRQLSDRLDTVRGYLPENEQMNEYVQQVSDRVTQTAGSMKDYAQQAASKVRDTAGDLGDIAQRAGTNVKQTTQDVADTTKQAARSTKNNVSNSLPGTGTSTTTNTNF